jgi:hypothetical protein
MLRRKIVWSRIVRFRIIRSRKVRRDCQVQTGQEPNC